MEQLEESKEEQLTDSELCQLDEVIRSARRFHYSSMLLATILAVIVLRGDIASVVHIPIWNIELPRLTAGMGLHFAVVVFTLLSYTTIRRVFYFMTLDQRRTPYPWYAISYKSSNVPIILWLMLPPVVSGMLVAFFATEDPIGLGLALISPLFVLGFPTVPFYWNNILAKSDERGGQATLSIYLLYWYRTIRAILTLGLISSAFFAISPAIRDFYFSIGFPFWAVISSIFGLRLLCGFGPVYRSIDSMGTRLGFPKLSEHYK